MSRHPRRALVAASLVSVLPLWSGCAMSRPPMPAPTSAELISLEDRYREDPTGHSNAALLAAGYLHIGRIDDAQRVLAEARSVIPEDMDLAFLSGLVEEAAQNPTGALAFYEAYSDADPPEAFLSEARGRSDRLRLTALPDSVRDLLGREAELARNPTNPSLVLMLPVAVGPGDEDLRPLARALSNLMPLDLESTGQFQAADQSRVRALLAAMGAVDAQDIDPQLVLRVRRILGAGVVIRAALRRVDADSIALEASVVSVGSEGVDSTTSFSGQALMVDVSGLERSLAEITVEAAGVEWSEQLQRRFGRGSSANLQAWIDHGRGLMALEAEQWASAEASFRAAVQQDDHFDIAADQAQAARYLELANEPPGPLAWRTAQTSSKRHEVRALLGASSGSGALRGLANERRAVLAELLGLDRLGSGSVVELIFKLGEGGGR